MHRQLRLSKAPITAVSWRRSLLLFSGVRRRWGDWREPSDPNVSRRAYNRQFGFVLCISRIFMGSAVALDNRALRRLKLSDLRLLHAVVQWGGMAKAATHLNISQPAVSKAIAALEHTL